MSVTSKILRNTGRLVRPGFSFLVFASLFFASCNDSAPPPQPASTCKNDGAKSGLSLAEEEKLDFQKDILPILSSSKDEEIYKCTFCHAGYSKEETFAKKEKIDAMIDQVESLKMPLKGDEMRKDQIEIIKKWRDQKFPAGVTPVQDDKKPALTIDWEDEDQAQKDEPKKEVNKPSTTPSSC